MSLCRTLSLCGLRLPLLRPLLGPSSAPLHTSPAVLGMPGVKKRKRLDPTILKAREERKVRRINRALKKMGKKDRILKPLQEMEVDPRIRREMEMRTRHVEVGAETLEERALLLKEWSRFCGARHKKEIQSIDKVMLSQQRALDELKAASPALYARAIEFDPDLVPFTARGPTRTPPLPQHLVDGEYHDTTRQFQVQYADMKKFMNELLNRDRKKKKKKTDEEGGE